MTTVDTSSSAELTIAHSDNPGKESATSPPAPAAAAAAATTTMTTGSGGSNTSLHLESLDLFNESAVQQLCGGFLQIFQPELLRVQDSLRELTVNQEEMLRSIQDKRVGLEDMMLTSRITNTLQKVPTYKAKLVGMSRQMQLLSKKVKRLQSRAVKLKEGRVQRETLARKEMERKAQQERLLEAKPAK